MVKEDIWQAISLHNFLYCYCIMTSLWKHEWFWSISEKISSYEIAIKQLYEPLLLTIKMYTGFPTDVIWMNKKSAVSLENHLRAEADVFHYSSTVIHSCMLCSCYLFYMHVYMETTWEIQSSKSYFCLWIGT